MPRLNYIRIVDDAFLSCTDDEIKLFCERYKKGIGVPFFVGGITPQNITRQKLSLLVDAGLVSLRMGIESASEKTLKMYRRNSSTKQIENAAKIINEFKDKIKLPIYDIIIENPWETDQEIAETLIFLSKLPVPYRMNLFSLRLFPGTALYENAKQKGFLEENDEDITNGPYKVLKKTYMNYMFLMLNQYVAAGKRLAPFILSLLMPPQVSQATMGNYLVYPIAKLLFLFNKKIGDIKLLTAKKFPSLNMIYRTDLFFNPRGFDLSDPKRYRVRKH